MISKFLNKSYLWIKSWQLWMYQICISKVYKGEVGGTQYSKNTRILELHILPRCVFPHHTCDICVYVFRNLYSEWLLALKSGKVKAMYNPYPVYFSYLESSHSLCPCSFTQLLPTCVSFYLIYKIKDIMEIIHHYIGIKN